MTRAVSLLLVCAAVLLAGCETGDLAPPRQVNPSVHREGAPNPSRHVPQARQFDENGWPIGR
jgi:PBP1b-binding outer membrane lipoprotein LpoB